ncbi:hypothetical protein SCHPADRAFT_937799 [Schizopora paradoxa]|uniref:F-box domain-containing protein n=1 Tax=Schizopora paradoxa TaxID=27342 RepID=A0A0H2RXX4_9AGAM|nr:hypothetical protein SCHPADRAFT_937799 [Schizopora paradoxa]
MRVPNGSNIPSEIWDCVFMHCERVIDMYTLEPEFFPNHRLHPLLLVCKEWHAIAERRLYTSVWLGSNLVVEDRDGIPMRIILAGKDVCQRFYKTVQSNHRLASLVRELHLGSMEINADETKLHIQLIKLCKNVESLHLCGCAHGFADHLKAALEITSLVFFKLSVRALTISPHGANVFSIPQLFSFIQTWPRLEILDVYLGEDTSRRFDIRKSLQPEGSVGMECTVVLQRCLNFLSSTLIHLHIWIAYDGYRHSTSAPIFNSPMAALRSLIVSMPMAPPSSLVYLPKLEWLTYYGEYEDGMELARVIEDNKLPYLRAIGVTFEAPPDENENRPPSRLSEDPPDETYLKVLLELHKVCGPRHIEVNTAWTLEELEQFVMERDSNPLADGSHEPEMPSSSNSDSDSGSEEEKDFL